MPEDVKAVRFARPVAVGPKGTTTKELQDTESDKGLSISIDRGLVVLSRDVDGKKYRKGWPLSGGAVLEVDFGTSEVQVGHPVQSSASAEGASQPAFPLRVAFPGEAERPATSEEVAQYESDTAAGTTKPSASQPEPTRPATDGTKAQLVGPPAHEIDAARETAIAAGVRITPGEFSPPSPTPKAKPGRKPKVTP